MKLESIKKLINDVIENEFIHISNYKECEDFNADDEINSSSEKIDKLLKKVTELAPEYINLASDLESEIAKYCTAACKYYFKEGVIAGTTNLKFLENTQIMHLA